MDRSQHKAVSRGDGGLAHVLSPIPVWEEAHERGFIEHHHSPGREAAVSVSALGAKFLAEHRRIIYER
jgi:hypothetical protein